MNITSKTAFSSMLSLSQQASNNNKRYSLAPQPDRRLTSTKCLDSIRSAYNTTGESSLPCNSATKEALQACFGLNATPPEICEYLLGPVITNDCENATEFGENYLRISPDNHGNLERLSNTSEAICTSDNFNCALGISIVSNICNQHTVEDPSFAYPGDIPSESEDGAKIMVESFREEVFSFSRENCGFTESPTTSQQPTAAPSDSPSKIQDRNTGRPTHAPKPETEPDPQTPSPYPTTAKPILPSVALPNQVTQSPSQLRNPSNQQSPGNKGENTGWVLGGLALTGVALLYAGRELLTRANHAENDAINNDMRNGENRQGGSLELVLV